MAKRKKPKKSLVKKFLVHPTVIIEENVQIGQGTKIWHFSQIRQGTKIGQNCIIGNSVFIDFETQIGNNVKIQNRAIIYHQAIIENGVFIGPNVCFTNDKLPRAINPDGTLKSSDDWQVSTIKIGEGASIGGHSVLTPGIKIGRFALIGAGSVVTKDVPDFALCYGNPAKIKDFVCKCGRKIKRYEPSATGRVIGFCQCGIKIEIAPEIYQLWQQPEAKNSYEKKTIHPDWKIDAGRVEGLSHIANVLSYPPAYYQRRLKKIGFFGKNTRLLDAACGSGIWAFAASNFNREVKAIDVTEKYLGIAQEIQTKLERKNLSFSLGKLEKLPYPDKYFDFIVSYNAWMYTDRKKSLKEMYRVLKPGGKIYLGCIAGLGYYLLLLLQGAKEGSRGLIFTAFKAIKDRVFMTEKESRGLLERQGFKVSSFTADGQIGDQKIAIESVYPAQKFGFWNVYEVLAEKS